MPNELLPNNIQFGTVVGRFGSAPLIAGDTDGLPDFSPATGLTVTFTPSTAAVIDATASPAPVTIEMVPIVCGLDTQGYLVGGDGQRGVKLIATNDTDINPSGWTYSVTFLRGGAKVAAFRDFSMSLPAGVTKDIALTIPVPSSEGVSLSQAQAAEAAAVSAASTATTAASTASIAASTAVAATATKVDKGSLVFNVKDYGAIGDGTTNATAAIQAAVDAASSTAGGGTVFVPDGTYLVTGNVPGTSTGNYLRDEGGIALKSNVHLSMAPNAILKAATTSQNQYVVLRCYNKTNVRVTGGTVKGERDTHIGTTGEWGYGLAISGGSNISVEYTKFINCWGDGINIQVIAGTPSIPAKNVYLNKVTCDNNRRQGMSVEGVDGLQVVGSTFSNTAGTAPQYGVDIEPYSDLNPVRNMTFTKCVFDGNAAGGMLAMMGSVTGLTVDDCLFINNANIAPGNGQLTTYLKDASGFLKFTNNRFESEGSGHASILIQGGHDYDIQRNTLVNGVIVTVGQSGSTVKNLSATGNTIQTASGITPRSDLFLLRSVTNATLRGNTFDASAQNSSRSLVRVETSTDIQVDRNRLVNSLRAVSVTDSTNVRVSNNTSDNPGIDFVDIGGASTDVRIEGNTVFGACHQNNGAATVYCSGTPSKVQVRNNTFNQAARDTTPVGFGTGVSPTAFGSAAGVALDTISSGNVVINDGTHSYLFYATSGQTLTTGYLGEGPGGVMAFASALRPSSPSKGSRFFDTTINKEQVYNGTTWDTRDSAASNVLPQAQQHLAGNYYFAGPAGIISTSGSLTVGALRVVPWLVPNSFTISRIGSDITVAGAAGALLRLGIYADNGAGYPGALLLDAGTIDATVASVAELTVSQVITPGLYWVGAVVQGAPATQPTVRVVQGSYSWPFQYAGTSMPAAGLAPSGFALTGVTGALPATFTSGAGTTGNAARLFVKAS